MAKSSDQGSCGCKGIRSCLVCESSQQRAGTGASMARQVPFPFVYSPATGLALGTAESEFAGWAFFFPGVCLIKDFVSEEEENKMVHLMDQDSWKLSQSGRRKQDYGPKVNFKKRKLKMGDFSGLPSFSQDLVSRMQQLTALTGFQPVEQCNLDYNMERGSAIDPHFDDCWLWGERLVTLNLLSDTMLTMSCDLEGSLSLVPVFNHAVTELQSIPANTYQPDSISISHKAWRTVSSTSPRQVPYSAVEVAINLPRRSLVVLAGDARYKWKHAIHRAHVKHRRVCSTFRELSAEFSCGGREESMGEKLLELALGFRGKPT